MSIYLERSLNGGSQVLHKFDNGFGASVVQHEFSYGGDEGLYELGVIKFESEDEWHLNYSTEVTDDVLGYLTEDDVESLLKRIEKIGVKSSYALTKLEDELKLSFKKISNSEEERDELEKQLESSKVYRETIYSNIKDLEATTTREAAREIKREFESYNSGNQFQIVQFVMNKVVR